MINKLAYSVQRVAFSNIVSSNEYIVYSEEKEDRKGIKI